MTFEEKLDRVIILLECLLEDKARTTGFTHIGTTLDIPVDVKHISTKELQQEVSMTSPLDQATPQYTQNEIRQLVAQYTQNDIRQLVAQLKNKGHNASDLKELLNKNGYTAISDIQDIDIDRIYNAFLSLA